MSSEGNPTVAAANEATGVEPLNEGPTGPQTPNMPQSEDDSLPPSLTSSLPPGCEPVAFPLELGSGTKSKNMSSSLPSAKEFEDLVKAKIHPSGPARSAGVEISALETLAGEEYAGLIAAVYQAVDGREVKLYKVETGVGKAEYYVMGLDEDAERIVGARVTGFQE